MNLPHCQPSSRRQVSGGVPALLPLGRPVVRHRGVHHRRVPQVQQQQRRGDQPHQPAGGDHAGLQPLDLRVHARGAAGARPAG